MVLKPFIYFVLTQMMKENFLQLAFLPIKSSVLLCDLYVLVFIFQVLFSWHWFQLGHITHS